MGKKRRLNQFIRKWIKSDLPEDRSPKVLLLGVTRIPTSPAPARRPCSLPLCPSPGNHNNNIYDQDTAQTRRDSFASRRNLIRRNSSKKRVSERHHPASSRSDERSSSASTWVTCSPESFDSNNSDTCSADSVTTPSLCLPNESFSGPVMDRSVDSIGTCSLDVEASADLSDWSEVSSSGTLRSASAHSPSPEPHLPSYLSLACTINGYCTTTNYDPIRLAKSRDASPHRPIDDHLTPRSYPTYSIQNNLLSPPNLVPLPTQFRSKNSKMSEDTLTQHHHQEFYSSSKTMTIMKESHFSSSLFSTDTIDACLENSHRNIKTFESNSHENKSTSLVSNGQNKCTTESSVKKEWKEESETKSFIKQRIERLYGPGALAQVVFPLKRQKSRTSESESEKAKPSVDQIEKPSNKAGESSEVSMKQSTSSPTLPVLRHLRPEFRAQLPIISPRKNTESAMQKSSTVPTLKDEVKLNGHSKLQEVPTAVPVPEIKTIDIKAVTEDLGEKNGHHFLKILDGEAKRLLALADQTEAELSTEGLSEEIVGKLRSASGKARLLVSQKMQQFKGLCTNNITQVEGEAFPTTNEDLQGFWDMVMLQVDQVNALFKEIETLKSNNWKEIKPVDVVDSKTSVNGSSNKTKKVITRPRQTTAANEEARKQREAQRKKMIEERRKAMKAQNKQQESIEIFVPDNS